MPNIPLPTGLKGDSYTPKQREVLKNTYFESGDLGTINTRPAARSVSNGIGRCRGAGLFKEELYQVSNDRLIKITGDLSSLIITDLGEIAGAQNCQLVAGFSALCIMVEAGAAYVYDSVNGLRQITDGAYKASISVDYDGGRFVFVPADGGPFFWSDLQDPAAINPIDFADAEEFPDPNKCVITRRRQIFVGGSRSFERLQYQPTLDTYATVGGATSNVGYVGGLTDFGETFMFLGRGVNGGMSFYIMGQTAEPLSNKTVDEILDTYTLEELEGIVGANFRYQATEFAVFYLPNHTLVYYGDWALWHNGTIGDAIGTWSVCFPVFAYGSIFCGDVNNRVISILTEDDTEYEMPVEGEITTFIRGAPRSNAMIRRIFINASQGINGSGSKIGLSNSRDGVIFSPMVYRSLGDPGHYAKEVSWGSPYAKLNDFLALTFRWTGSMRISVDQVYYD